MMKKLKQKFRSNEEKNKEKWFLKNGGIFLKKLIVDCNGISIPIHNFSSSQIVKATNNFDDNYLVNYTLDGGWYRSIIDDKPYWIKKFVGTIHGDVYNDIVLSARMSNHNNFLKLIGCCFEFHLPVVVFEYEELSTLTYFGRSMVNGKEFILPWSVRLKITKELAIAVTYLHTAFSKIIIHRCIMMDNIFLDKNSKAKLINFMFSQSLPEGKTRIKYERADLMFSYMDPLFVNTRSLSEYTDVHSFGICLLVFLTGKSVYTIKYIDILYHVKSSYENDKLDEVIDPVIAKDITSDQRLQVEAFLVLALKCCNEEREEERPKMIQVVKELKRIEQMKWLDASSSIGSPKHEMLEDGDKSVSSGQ